MKTYTILGIALCSLLSLPALALSQEQALTGEKSLTFPDSYNTYTCSVNSPCRNVTGKIMRIEESYWIRNSEGGETHLKVTRDTKMENLPKVGDIIGAKLSSSGEANAIVKLEDLPKPKEFAAPSLTQKDLR
ncbi:MAG TPA: hypothetical protein VIW47_01350 [Nitrospiraceae bacterium]